MLIEHRERLTGRGGKSLRFFGILLEKFFSRVFGVFGILSPKKFRKENTPKSRIPGIWKGDPEKIPSQRHLCLQVILSICRGSQNSNRYIQFVIYLSSYSCVFWNIWESRKIRRFFFNFQDFLETVSNVYSDQKDNVSPNFVDLDRFQCTYTHTYITTLSMKS